MRPIHIAAILAFFALAAGSAFAFVALADHIARQDRELFAQYDASRNQMLARACGSSGRLWLDPISNEHGCLYVNSDGTAMLQELAVN